jgi:hypothetical protein
MTCPPFLLNHNAKEILLTSRRVEVAYFQAKAYDRQSGVPTTFENHANDSTPTHKGGSANPLVARH